MMQILAQTDVAASVYVVKLLRLCASLVTAITAVTAPTTPITSTDAITSPINHFTPSTSTPLTQVLQLPHLQLYLPGIGFEINIKNLISL